jgi:hypothetical protein
MADRKDIYDRRATSTSRGKTIQRIMDLQHGAGTIPGTEAVLGGVLPDGSIGAAITAFHAGWVEGKPVTTKRAYERSLALLARDLDANGPAPSDPVGALDRERIVAHLDWRISNGLHDAGELQRAALHLTRLCEWANEHLGAGIHADRAWMREQAATRIASAPPAYHVATSAAELRDTSGDADALA